MVAGISRLGWTDAFCDGVVSFASAAAKTIEKVQVFVVGVFLYGALSFFVLTKDLGSFQVHQSLPLFLGLSFIVGLILSFATIEVDW